MVLALLSGAIDSGVMDAVRTKRSSQQIADITGIDERAIAHLWLALKAHGVVLQDGEYYQLTPDYALPSLPTAAIPLSNVIHYAMVMIRSLQEFGRPDVTYTTTATEDVLAMAEGSGVSALSPSSHASWASVVQLVPEVEAVWRAGARQMEVGCGVGNSLFGTVTAYPNVTAVGIEIDESTAGEAERRAHLLGVSDRVELRRMDACELQDEDVLTRFNGASSSFPLPVARLCCGRCAGR